jgi:hypothetical protein
VVYGASSQLCDAHGWRGGATTCACIIEEEEEEMIPMRY